ncbi:MAG: neutral/alkaline non-lysosomal ceramidase N-terminal domain-containing protein [Oscillospiraceae bacterium]|nr:neutral/alkaline non-lysosomal ceramidase N-terminal domain-containing protein [Oscillospiraceae bacterium]
MSKYDSVYFGAAKDIITPPKKLPLIGFAHLFGTDFTDVHDDLYVKSLILRDVDGETVVLMSFDLLFHDDSLADELRKYVSEKYGIPPENLHVTYTHTHFAPAVKGYELDWYTNEYEAFLYERSTACIDRALMCMKKGTLEYSSVTGEWNISRRLLVDGEMMFRPNIDGECDKSIYLLKLADESGKTRALALNFACHPSNLSAQSVISSEYPGRLCQLIESEFYGTTAIFFQGFGSDAKLKIGASSSRRFRVVSYDDCNEAVIGMVQKIKAQLMRGEWQKLPVKLGSDVFSLSLPLEIYPKEHYEEFKRAHEEKTDEGFALVKGTPEDIEGNVRRFYLSRADFLLDNYEVIPDELMLSCGVIRINPDFYIFSMGGEPGCNIASNLRKAFSEKQIICFGYNNAVAYIPSDKMISEGGYEAAGASVEEYRLKGCIKSGVDKIYEKGYYDAMKRIEKR